MSKSVIIIGGGLAGLSAGCFLRMNGFTTSIFEMHNITGGVCTGWKRKDYTFDGAMHWLVGTKPGTSFYPIWEELGATKGWTIVDHDRYMIAEGANGKRLNIYADIDRLEKHMIETAPEDTKVIHEFTKAIRGFRKMEMPVDKAPELYNLIDMLKMVKMLPSLRLLNKWSNITTRNFIQRFKNPFMREALSAALAGDLEDFPMIFLMMTFAMLDQKAAGYLVGGALELSRRIEKRYLDLGGVLKVSSRVTQILVENNRAVGIKTEDGQEYRGDIVISAADGHTTLFDMLEGNYLDEKTRQNYEHPQLFPPLIYVSLGVKRAFNDIPSSVTGLSFPIPEPITIAGKENRRMDLQIYNFDNTLAPGNKTVLKTQFMTDYDYWKKLKQDPEQYKLEKARIAGQVISRLDKRYPGFAGQVEVLDVATPLTWERYTGNWRGSYEGWLLKKWRFSTRMSKTLSGLDNFFMIGQWVEPGGGMPTAVMSGRNVTQIICKKEKIQFVTTKP